MSDNYFDGVSVGTYDSHADTSITCLFTPLPFAILNIICKKWDYSKNVKKLFENKKWKSKEFGNVYFAYENG